MAWAFWRRGPQIGAPRGRPFATRDGGWVRSQPEQRIADWLSRQGLQYEYEPDVEGLRPDFVLRDRGIIIEYWGGAGYRKYAAKMVEKTERFEAAGWRVVHITAVNLWELEKRLTKELGDVGPQG